jgi:hypothetical protein
MAVDRLPGLRAGGMARFQSILMPVPEAEATVGPFRRDGDWSSAHGVPTHMTIAGPWPLSLRLPTRALAGLAAAIRGTPFVLGTVGRLGDAICLFPEDDRDLLRWRASILAAVGDADGLDEGWRLHLTVCRGATEEATTVEEALDEKLPIACEAPGLLLAQMDGDSGASVRRL